MTDLLVSPELVGSAATSVDNIGASLASGNAAAAALTTDVASAATDQVSTSIAALFSQYGQDYQKLAAQAAAFHDEFVLALTGAGHSYAATEAANTSPLQAVEQEASLAV